MRLLRSLTLVPWILSLAGCGSRDEPRPLRVFAAASLSEVCGDLARAFGKPVRFNFAGSNTLARQILAAPGCADVFLSADRAWADALVDAGLASSDPVEFLSNQLVVVGRPRAAGPLSDPAQLATLGLRHLALADPDAVPAGRYARAWLESIPLGESTLWEALAPLVVPTLDVRAALALVESQPEILGIVYATDARRARVSQVLYRVPPDRGPRISYVALCLGDGGSDTPAQDFSSFLQSPAAREIGSRYGFRAPH